MWEFLIADNNKVRIKLGAQQRIIFNTMLFPTIMQYPVQYNVHDVENLSNSCSVVTWSPIRRCLIYFPHPQEK